ncbi:DNA repair protein RAD16 [Coemansia erecta]|uniref:DNA repair protein RAD16 n=1 Tax=Coemansia erecta TaxID=147472 RepID=A0A9W7XTT3_9FUNG|nr:DNA repair protein RAD16 [Coemansia erecta]
MSSATTTWLASNLANILYAVSRLQLFCRLPGDQVPAPTKVKLHDMGLPENIVPVLRVPPKLQLLAQILKEIGAANLAAVKKGGEAGLVLVMAGLPRECRMIQSYLASFQDTVCFDIPGQDGHAGDADSHPRMMVNLLQGFFKWKALMSSKKPVAVSQNSSQASTASARAQVPQGRSQGQGASVGGQANRAPPPSKRRRVRGASSAASGVLRAPADKLEEESAELAASISSGDGHTADRGILLGFGMHNSETSQTTPAATATKAEDASGGATNKYLDDDDADWAEELETFDEHFGILSGNETIVVQLYSSRRGLLSSLRPTQVVMYDPDPVFIREIELYQANGVPLKLVYFLVYDNSIEEQRYLSAIRRERESFEKLIHDKSTAVIPLSSPGAQSGGGLATSISPSKALLGIVASRSHRNTRDSTVQGAEEQVPTVVIDVREFRSSLPSLLHAAGFKVVPRTIDIGDYILHDNLVIERKPLPDLIGSLRSGRLYNQAEAMLKHYQYAALLVEFKVNTSFSLQAMGGITADIERAVTMGQEDTGVERESIYTQSPIALLQSLPGVSLRDYQALARKYRNIRRICAAKKDELEQVLDKAAAGKLYEFLHATASNV